MKVFVCKGQLNSKRMSDRYLCTVGSMWNRQSFPSVNVKSERITGIIVLKCLY